MKKLLLLCLTLAGCFACSDFLNIRPEGTSTSEGMDYSKAENIFKPVSAAYASLRVSTAHKFAYICVCEITSDDADKGSSPEDNPDARSLDEFTFDASCSLINELWTGFYDIVSAANNVLYQMVLFDAKARNAAVREQIRTCEAEGRFLRAYSYFNLVRMFGSVPIVDKTLTAEELASLRQSTSEEVYAFIVKDLEYAVSHLPETYPAAYKGRVTKDAAMTLLAKVHLYRKQYDRVAALCGAVIAGGRHGLLSDFREVFSIDGENSKESLFEIQSSDLGLSSGESAYSEFAYYQGPRGNSPSNMQGWGFCVPSAKLIAFLNGRGDTERAKATFLYRGTKTPEGDSIKVACTNPVYNGKVYTPSAYNDWSYNGYGFDYNIRILRYPDVLLMYAEALARGAAPAGTCDAQQALDLVRSRAGLPSVPPTLENILEERHAEFALEEDRFFDLVRTGMASKELASKGFVEGKHNLFPIPAAQRQLNANLRQNPNY